MGVYTQSIREILQMNKTPQQSLENVQDVYAIAHECLFDKLPSNTISSEYLEAFETGFALHFFNEELGLETLPLWKIALNEKVYNNYSYINLLFSNLDKQIFSEYNVTNRTNSSTDESEKTSTGTITNSRDEDVTTNVSDTITRSETVESSETGSVAGTGTVANAKTGKDTLDKTGTDTKLKTGSETTTHDGTDTNVKSGSDTTTHTGTDRNAKTGTDTVERTGTDTNDKSGNDTLDRTGTNSNAHTGTQTVAGTNSSTINNTGTTTDNHNTQQINSDTPMGSLSNLRAPGGNASGTGVAYVQGQTYNYMSSAVEFDETNVKTDNTSQGTTGSYSDTTTFNDTMTETPNLKDKTTYDSQDKRTLDLEDKTTYNSTDLRTANLEDEVTYDSTDTKTLDLQDQTTYNVTDRDTLALKDEQSYNSTNTETRNTLDTTNKSDTSERTGSEGKTGRTVVDGTVSDEQERDLADNETRTHAETGSETGYKLNWEMLYKSMPLINRVWTLFDDLFMLIY